MKKYIVVVIIILSGVTEGKSQKYIDVGFNLLSSSLYGDVSEFELNKSIGFGGEFLCRYYLAQHINVRANVGYAQSIGYGKTVFDTELGEYEDGYLYDVTASMFYADLMAEMDWFEFDLNYKDKDISPYLGVGIGVAVVDSAPYLSVPAVFGVKITISNALYFNSEFYLRKFFSDKIDGYDNPLETGTSIPDPYDVTTALHNNDWTGGLKVGVVYRLDKWCLTCPKFDE